MKTQLSYKKKGVLVIALALVLVTGLSLSFAACSPGGSGDSSTQSESQNLPENVALGEFETIGEDPDMLADGTSGMSVHEGAGDEALQQDRVSGGANTGGVVSQNLPDLENDLILPQSNTNPAPDLLEVGHPQQIPHTLDGRDDCLSCHGMEKAERPLPRDHVKAGLTSDLCLICHKGK